MKKTAVILSFFVSICLVGCSGNKQSNTPTTDTYTVYFDSNGGTPIEPQIVEEGKKLSNQ